MAILDRYLRQGIADDFITGTRRDILVVAPTGGDGEVADELAREIARHDEGVGVRRSASGARIASANNDSAIHVMTGGYVHAGKTHGLRPDLIIADRYTVAAFNIGDELQDLAAKTNCELIPYN